MDDDHLWDSLNTPSGGLAATWEIGTFGPFDEIEDLSLFFEVGINEAWVPASSTDYVECVDNDLNNGQSLLELIPDPEFEMALVEGDGVLVGPTYDTNPVSATPIFAAQDTQCAFPLCSRLHFTEAPSNWRVHNLILFSSGPVEIGDGDEIEYVADWLRIDLIGGAIGTEVGTNKFEIAPGAALFQIGGTIGGAGSHLMSAANASKITIEKRGSSWWNHSFSIVVKDADLDVWTVTIGRSEWESDPL